MSSEPAPDSWDQLVPFHSSGVVTTTLFSFLPAMVSTWPSGSAVKVGYHRPKAISGPLVQEPLGP